MNHVMSLLINYALGQTNTDCVRILSRRVFVELLRNPTHKLDNAEESEKIEGWWWW